MKRILLIGLGGTIVCSFSKEGLIPKYSLEDLLSKNPRIKHLAKIETVQLMKRTVVYPRDWRKIVELIIKSLNKFDGFVITMGTDTLAYTSSMLSFMLLGINKPVIITGAMFSLENSNSDAKKNLTDSILFTCEGYSGVYVVFNGKVINGCRASKVHCNSITAFKSINFPYFAKISNGKVICRYKKTSTKSRLLVNSKIDTNIVTIKLNPQTPASLFDLFSDYRALIIDGYGDGNISDNLISAIIKLIKNKQIVIIASQCPYGKSEHKYRGGYLAIKNGAISSRDMSKEAILTKLMWCLGKTKSLEKIKKLMYKNVCGEINENFN